MFSEFGSDPGRLLERFRGGVGPLRGADVFGVPFHHRRLIPSRRHSHFLCYDESCLCENLG